MMCARQECAERVLGRRGDGVKRSVVSPGAAGSVERNRAAGPVQVRRLDPGNDVERCDTMQPGRSLEVRCGAPDEQAWSRRRENAARSCSFPPIPCACTSRAGAAGEGRSSPPEPGEGLRCRACTRSSAVPATSGTRSGPRRLRTGRGGSTPGAASTFHPRVSEVPRRVACGLPESAWTTGCLAGENAPVHLDLEADLDYEIEVQELKDRRRSFGRLAIGALVVCVLALVLRHLV